MTHTNTSGSEWRKWDLHVHTPFSKLNDGFKLNDGDDLESESFDGKKWEKWFKFLKEKEISVVGVTDYFSINNYLEAKKRKIEFSSNISLLPNIEFRINQQNKDNEFINIHVIFSNKESVENRIPDFLTRLKLISTDDITLTNKFCTDTDLNDIGYKKAIVEKGILEKALGENFKKTDEYIIVGVARGHGSIRPGEGDDGRGSEYAKEIDKVCSIFYGNKDDVDFYLNETQVRPKTLLPKPVFLCCDAHCYQELGTKFTWVKSDPNYKGLLQTIYEPKERVRIQAINPTFEFNKPYFSNIEIEKDINIFQSDENQVLFTKSDIPINKNLVTIIGGRGTGKSMLINYFTSLFFDNNDEFTSSQDFKINYAKDNIENSSFSVFKGDEENVLDFIFIPQSELKSKTEKSIIGNEVRKLLQLKDYFFSQELNERIQKILSDINDVLVWFNQEDEDDNKINNRKFITDVKTRNQKLLESITTKDNKEKLEKYTRNIALDSELEKEIAALKEIKKEISDSIEAFNEYLGDINKQTSPSEEIHTTDKNNIVDKLDGFPQIDFSNIQQIPLFDITKQNEIINNNIKTFESQKETGQNENKKIKEDFEKVGFKGDLQSLLQNAENYQSNIKWADSKLIVIEKKEQHFENLTKSRGELGKKIKDEYERQKKSIDNAWKNILSKHSPEQQSLIKKILLKDGFIKVTGAILFNKKMFYDLMFNSYVDKRSYKSIEVLEDYFKIQSLDDWVNFIANELQTLIEKEETKFPNILDMFFSLRERSKYISTSPLITYKQKPLERLSVGQRGTVYLCLKLATDAFSKPIVFDQPEDDLDNSFIVDELVEIFKDLKKYRQIIIVTHNANLVVNSDTEQVIIASNNEEKLSYCSGSLENQTIIDGVCNILEGGTDAFEKRRNKYNI